MASPQILRGRGMPASSREEFFSPAGNLIVWEDCRTNSFRSSSPKGPSPFMFESPQWGSGPQSFRSGGLGIDIKLDDNPATNSAPRLGIDIKLDDKPALPANQRQGIDIKLDENPQMNLSFKSDNACVEPKQLSTPRSVSPKPVRSVSPGPVSYLSQLSPVSQGALSNSTRAPSSVPPLWDRSPDQSMEQTWNSTAEPPPGGWSRALKAEESSGLKRFTKPQHSLHKRAVREIYAGKKQSCWMWFCFPTPPYMVNGKEVGSARNRMYAIRSDEEAADFLTFEADGVNLRNNYFEVVTAVRDKMREGVAAKTIFGFIDDPKLRSSISYFERMTRGGVDQELHRLLMEVLQLLDQEPEGPAASVRNASRPKSLPPKASSHDDVAPSQVHLQYKKKLTDAVAPHFRSDDRAKKWEQDNPHAREHSKPDPKAIRSYSRSASPSKQRTTIGVAPKLRSDKRHDVWEAQHKELREQHDALHADHQKVRKELRHMTTLDADKLGKSKTTVASAPSFRSDRRHDEWESNHKELREQHDTLHADHHKLRKELRHMTTLDADRLGKSQTTVASAPSFRSDRRHDEWESHHKELREQHDALHADHQKVRKELRHATTLNEQEMAKNREKVTSPRAPTFRSDARANAWQQNH